MISLLQAVIMLNDAQTLVTVLSPLIEQARALGHGDDHVFTEAELDARAASVGLNAQSLRDMVK